MQPNSSTHLHKTVIGDTSKMKGNISGRLTEVPPEQLMLPPQLRHADCEVR